jgi:hypothetical protein
MSFLISLVYAQTSERRADRGVDFVSRTRSVDDDEYSPLTVELEQWTGVGMENFQPPLDHQRVGVVRATHIRPTCKTCASHVVRDVETDDRIGKQAGGPREPVRPLGLRKRARNTVEDVSAGSDRAYECIADDRQDKIVGDEFAAPKAIAHPSPQFAVLRNVATQQVPA